MMRNRSSVYVAALLAIGCAVFLFGNLSFAGTVELPKTGQTTCYDDVGYAIPCAGTGEDGEIQAGVAWPEPRFTDNGDGTVTDNLTGLMWLKHANCFGAKTWQEALYAAADLNANPGAYTCVGAGYTDWRLPNRKELHSLTDFSRAGPALPGHPFLNVQPIWYWSSTTYAHGSDDAWVVYMDAGVVGGPHKSDYYFVWPVRAGQTGSLAHIDIKANGQDGPIVVSPSTPISIDISLDPGDQAGLNAEWWIVVQWPFGMFKQYYSYVYPIGWLPGINRCIEMPLINLAPLNVLTTPLFPGDFEFFFLIDDNVNGIPDGTWVDSVKVTVQ